MSRLAIEHRAINLGQGFPDDRGPDLVLDAAAKALYDPPNQYPPMLGVQELREAVAAHNRRFYGIEVDWKTETKIGRASCRGKSGSVRVALGGRRLSKQNTKKKRKKHITHK